VVDAIVERVTKVKVVSDQRLDDRAIFLDISLIGLATEIGSTGKTEPSPTLGMSVSKRRSIGSSGRDVALGLRRLPKIAELCVERAVEGWSCGAPLNISSEALVARHDVSVAQNAQHG
jgi:hypothetical protein